MNKWYQSIRRHIICADGTVFSIQASDYHYSEPKKSVKIEDEDFKGYKSVEIMCEDGLDEDILAEHNSGMGVYEYVPAHKVIKLLKRHGGAIQGEIPPLIESAVTKLSHKKEK
tara:strand:- start:474 stop:812 length:339 start_codon:yes stop_codon:yes gene_type:complete